MKKLLFLFTMAFAVILGLNSCGEETPPPVTLSVSPLSLNFPAEGGSQTVQITTNAFWHAIRYETFFNVNGDERGSPSGEGNTTITVNVSPNTSTNPRQGNIRIWASGRTDDYRLEMIGVTQAGTSGGGGGTAPSIPTGGSATVSGNSVNLSWNSVSGATSYRIYRSSSASGTFSPIGTIAWTTFTDNSPLTGNNSYRVRAINSAGESQQSSTFSVNFTGGGGGITAPSTPTGLSGFQSGSAILLSWNSVSGATSYRVYRSNSSFGTFTLLGTPSGTSFNDNNPLSGNNFYRVSAVNSAGASNQSSSVQVNFTGGGGGTPQQLATPTGLEATQGTFHTFVQISFNPVPLAHSYELQRGNAINGPWTNIPTSTGTSGGRVILTDPNPRAGVSWYRVRAVNNVLPNLTPSNWSTPVQVTR